MTGRIQVEIKQSKPFERLESEALVGLLRTAALLDHASNEALKPYGITQTQYNVLRILRGAGTGGLCGREIGERMIARVPDVPRLLDRMVEAGLISRERDTHDRRHVTARISPEGLQLLERVTPVLERVESHWLGGMGDERLRTLIDALDSMRSHE